MMESFDERPIMLHVRRGDPNLADKRGFKWAYVNLQDQHPVQTLEYYEEALRQFPENVPVIVFSDSIDWCKEQEFFSDDRFNFSESTDKHEDGPCVMVASLPTVLCPGGVVSYNRIEHAHLCLR
jgi:glutaredoxin